MNALNNEPSQQASGKIITFYSYKGGTGRSMALANTAWLLALNGNRVLVVDWDLEAPGLHRYFHPFLLDKELRTTSGLMEMVEDMAVRAAASKEPLEDDDIDIVEYITMLECPRESAVRIPWSRLRDRSESERTAIHVDDPARPKRPASPYVGIDLMAAGRQDGSYSRKLSTFNWIDFYERLDGRRLLGLARKQMCEMYDYILIDSRTGVSDTSGICTVEMPDALVICFTLNDQSIRGAAGIAESIREQRRVQAASPSGTVSSAPDFRIFPVPTRVEITAEKDKRETALAFAQDSFGSYLSYLSAEEQSKYWGSVQMAYFPYYAFEEILAVFAEKPNDVLSLGTPLKYLMAALTDGKFAGLPPLDPSPEVAERLRLSVLNWYLRPKNRRNDPVSVAQKLHDEFDDAHRRSMQRTLLRLVSIERTALSPRTALLTDFSAEDARMARTLADRELLAISGAEGAHSVRLRDAVLLEKWDTLHHWIEEDRAFLTWRNALGGSLNSWKLSDFNESALLRGSVLDEAMRLSASRHEDLCDDESGFIRASMVARDNAAEADRVARSQAAAIVQAAGERNAELESQIAKMDVAKAKQGSWFNRHGVKVGAALGVVAMVWVGLSVQRTAEVQKAVGARVDSAAAAESQKFADSIATLSRKNDSILAVLQSQGVGSNTTRPPNQSQTVATAPNNLSNAGGKRPNDMSNAGGEAPSMPAPATDAPRTATPTRRVDEAAMLFRQIESDNDAAAKFSADEWLTVLPPLADALRKGNADERHFRALSSSRIPRTRVAPEIRAVVVRRAYEACTAPSKGSDATAAAAFSALAAWSPEAAVVAASTVMSSGEQNPSVVAAIARDFNRLQKEFYALKLPELKAGAEEWSNWTKEHNDFVQRWRPGMAAAR